MPAQVKQAGIVSILTALFTFMIIGVVGWFGIMASHVPALEQEIRLEVRQLNKSISSLTKTAIDTNKQLENYTKFHAANLSRITEALLDHKYKIIALEEDCNLMQQSKKQCDKHILIYDHNGKNK